MGKPWGGIIIYSNLFVSSAHLQPDTAQGLSGTPCTQQHQPGSPRLGPCPQGPASGRPPEMPLLVEWTFIMDWHKLEKIPFGIGECRRKGQRGGDPAGSGGGLAWLRGAWLPSQPPHICRSPTNTHCVCVRTHAGVRLDPSRVPVGGPIDAFICACLSIWLSVSGVERPGRPGTVSVLCHRL